MIPKIDSPQSQKNAKIRYFSEQVITLMQRMAQATAERIVLMMVKWTNQESQYGKSVIPIIRIDSLVRDSFSLTIQKTLLYKGTMQMTTSVKGSINLMNQPYWSNVELLTGGSGIITVAMLALGSLVVFFRMMLATRFCKYEYPLSFVYQMKGVTYMPVSVGL